MSAELRAYMSGTVGLDYDALTFDEKLKASESFLRTQQATPQGIKKAFPYKKAVYILGIQKEGLIRTIGTAFAITTTSKALMLTAGHCVFDRDSKCLRTDLVIIGSITCADGDRIYDAVIPVEIVWWRMKGTIDIAIIRRIDERQFATTLELENSDAIPMLDDGYDHDAKVYYCNISDNTDEYFGIISAQHAADCAITTISRRHFQMSMNCLPGTSGGPVVSVSTGKVIGVVIERAYETSELQVSRVETFKGELESIVSTTIVTSFASTMAISPVCLRFLHHNNFFSFLEHCDTGGSKTGIDGKMFEEKEEKEKKRN